jgi:hypothetical protein
LNANGLGVRKQNICPNAAEQVLDKIKKKYVPFTSRESHICNEIYAVNGI